MVLLKVLTLRKGPNGSLKSKWLLLMKWNILNPQDYETLPGVYKGLIFCFLSGC